MACWQDITHQHQKFICLTILFLESTVYLFHPECVFGSGVLVDLHIIFEAWTGVIEKRAAESTADELALGPLPEQIGVVRVFLGDW